MQEELTSRMGEKESVTKSGVQLLTPQKPIKKEVGGGFALF